MSNAYDIGDLRWSPDELVGRKVAQLIWDRKLTQSKAAALLEMDQSSLAKRLRGYRGWSVPNILTAARVLETTAAYLLGETEDPRDPKRPRQDSNLRPRDYKGVLSQLIK
jgi:transcriptional regulator with XRE-family HTH domain